MTKKNLIGVELQLTREEWFKLYELLRFVPGTNWTCGETKWAADAAADQIGESLQFVDDAQLVFDGQGPALDEPAEGGAA